MPGSACATDGNECTDDVCNGTGLCLHPFNNAPCDDGDVCTFDGMCAFGSCQKMPANERPLADYRMKASFGPGFDDDKMSLKAAMYIPNMQSSPTQGGFSLALRDASDAILYESIIAPELWSDLTGNGSNYRYRSDGSAPPQTGGMTQMQVKYRRATGLAKIKGKGALQELQTLVGQPLVSARIQVGNDAAGICAQAFELPCTAKSTTLSCP